MSSAVRNPLKIALRKKLKESLKNITEKSRNKQSNEITKKILASSAFRESKRISIYLSLSGEVNTQTILLEMFRQKKEVFVPSYSGNKMVMLKINDIEDYESLPLTKWNIRQPEIEDGREDATQTGGLDLILLPGVAFSVNGGRLGHGMGYYDKFLADYFLKNPHRHNDNLRRNIPEKIAQKNTILLGLAFKEQVFDEIPLEPTDVLLDEIVTSKTFIYYTNCEV